MEKDVYPEDKHRLIIDEEAAEVVRMIFDLVLEGKTKGWIVKYLNDKGIPTPGEHFAQKGMKRTGSRNVDNPRWTVTTISDMLRNEVYIGNVCWNKSNSRLRNGKRVVKNKREDWIITENAHEPIVSREVFNEANEKGFTGRKKTSNNVKPCPLIYCAYCGRTLSAPKDGNHTKYRCMNGYGTFAEKDCMKVRIKGADLEQAVLKSVNLMADLYCENRRAGTKRAKAQTEILSAEQEKLFAEQEKLKDLRTRLYIEYRSGGTKEDYLRKREEVGERLSQLEESIADYDRKLEIARKNDILSLKTSDAMEELKGIQSFDKEKIKQVIDKVVVYGADKFEIIWKPMDALFNSISEKPGFIEI